MSETTINIAEAMEPEYGSARNAATIKIVGVGGGGGNAANRMYEENILDVDFVLVNSDVMDLNKSRIPSKIAIGEGHGCGSDHELGAQYAREKTGEIEHALEGCEMVFIAASMGGGTGTGAAPVVAEIAKKKGILTVAITTLPYLWEGTQRTESALKGIEMLSQNVDSIIVISNQAIREEFGNLPVRKGWAKADQILLTATKSIAEILQKTGFVNVDFNDVRAVMRDSGVAVMGAGTASGENRARSAVEKALQSSLLNKANIKGAKKILMNITSNEENELTSDEMQEIMDTIRTKAQNDVSITWGYMVGAPDDGSEIGITLIATGFTVDDIPEFKKPEKEEVIYVNTNESSVTNSTNKEQNVANQTATKVTSSNERQTSLFGTSSFIDRNYKSISDMSDEELEALENESALSRSERLQKEQNGSQKTAVAVESMQKNEPTQFTLDVNANEIIFEDKNKYLNHNVD